VDRFDNKAYYRRPIESNGMTDLNRNFVSLLLVCAGLDCSDAVLAASNDPCVSAEHHAFDFWIGDWKVVTPNGKLAGFNHVTREYRSCVVHEHYTTENGYSGESLNIYDATRKLWHQTWVDTAGTLLTLEGSFHDGQMVLYGSLIGADGKSNQQRITWTPNSDGSVRQLWEAKNDKGAWTVVFDGKYIKQ
jgi:hypothetical protein